MNDSIERPSATPGARSALRELAGLFLKLGLIAFGGPAAHIALMRTEVVERRKWVTEQQFLDLLGDSNLIPGPTSTELAIYLGYTRAGPAGLVLAGVLFHSSRHAARVGLRMGICNLWFDAAIHCAPLRHQARHHRRHRAGDLWAVAHSH